MQLLCLGDVRLTGDQSPPPAWALPADFSPGPGARLVLNWEIADGNRSGQAGILRKWSPGIAALANRRSLEVKEEGLACTVESLRQIGFKTLGAGTTPEEASRPLLWETAEGDLTILNWVFTKMPAETGASGANRWPGLRDAEEIIRTVKRTSDWVLVIMNWNDGPFPHPQAEHREIARQIAEFGADALIGHHSYSVRGMEFMGACPAFYGLGTFFSSKESSNVDEETAALPQSSGESLGVRFNFQHGKPLEYELFSFWNNHRAVQRDHAERAFRRMNSMSRILHEREGDGYLDWYERERICLEENDLPLGPLGKGLSRSLRRWAMRAKMI